MTVMTSNATPSTASALIDISTRVTVLVLHGKKHELRAPVEHTLADFLLAQPWFSDLGMDASDERSDEPPMCAVICALNDPEAAVRRLGAQVSRVVPDDEAIVFCEDFPVYYAAAAFAAALAPELCLPHEQLRVVYTLAADMAGLKEQRPFVLSEELHHHRERLYGSAVTDTYHAFIRLADETGLWPAFGDVPLAVLPGSILHAPCACGAQLERTPPEFRCPSCGARST